MRFAAPIRWHSAAPIVRPVIISSLAMPSPTTAGRRLEPPTSGISPSFVSGRPNFTSSAITRRSQASASSAPSPRQAPWICATTGLVISSSRFAASMQSRRNGRRFSVPARPAELEDVDARAERGALAAQHHAVDVVVVGGLAGRLPQREHQIAG